jgi:chromosome segregation ATPase
VASCAACLQPLLRSQRFALEGTEVFHVECLGQAYRSKLRMAEQRSRELEAQLADTRRAAARVEAETSRFRNESMSRAAEVISLEGRLAGVRAELELSQERLRARQGELQGARNQNAALRAELAAVKQEAPAVRPEDGPQMDDSSLRFSLLELERD